MIRALWQSSVILKGLMALSGLAMVGFLVGHLAGNLLIFLGKDALNGYAAKLHEMPAVLWVVRIGLLGALVIHVLSAITLTRRNRQSRSRSYAVKHAMGSSLASRQMAVTGTLVLFYVVYHLAHFTLKWTHPEFQHNPGDVHGMIVASFGHPLLTASYVLAMVMVGFHLHHGIQSAFESLGFYHSFYTPLVRKAAMALAMVLVVGFSSVPLAVYFGFIS